jgi:hypothetical protein
MPGIDDPYIPRMNLNAGGGQDGGLGTAVQNFNDGLRSLALSRAYSSATQQVQDLQNQGLSDAETQKQQSQIANDLGRRMIAMGFGGSQLQSAVNFLAPQQKAAPSFSSPIDLAVNGTPEQQQSWINFAQQLKPPKEPDELAEQLKQQKLSDAEDNAKFNTLGKLRKATNEAEQSSRNTLGQLAQKANTLTDLNGLIGDPSGWNQKTNFHIQELATGLDRIFKGGVATETGTAGLMPSDLQMKMAQMKQYATSEPTPANQAAFIGLYNDVLQRTGGILDAQLSGYKKNTLSAIPSIAKKYPEDFDQLSQSVTGEGAKYQNGKVVFDTDQDQDRIAQKIKDLSTANLSPQTKQIALRGIESDPQYWNTIMRNKPLASRMRMIKGSLQGVQ